MLPSQKAAVDLNMVELVEAVEWTTPAVLSYFLIRGILSKSEMDLVEGKVTDALKLNSLFHILQSKDSSWSLLISYLKSNNHLTLAEKLIADAGGNTVNRGPKPKLMPKPTLSIKRSALEEFSLRLANYYQLHYADLPTMGQSPKHVKDVWVPLQIDGRSEDHLTADRIDHIELLNRLKSTEGRNVALIKGDPGMGKTTLVKKVAYDWAISYAAIAKVQKFTLVLAVPLRHAEKSDRFDQLAIDYFLSTVDVEGINRTELAREICKLESQLLVILDGLDEYAYYGESPFKDMFEAPFKHNSTSRRVKPPTVSFKLIVTSRPYACERAHDEFWPLRFAILPLDANHLGAFVNFYCHTSQGIAKVVEYLKINAELVINVPLILTFVCYLADSAEEIPTNMTSLYEQLIRQMIRREIRQGKLAEPVDMQNWKESNVVKSTGDLAFLDFKDKSTAYEFNSVSLDICHVTNDSFICGFLLHKFDFARDLLKAEFPHRSIQEFFAALHCYQLMLKGRKNGLGDIRYSILRNDSQFGRFLFGICSQEGKFVPMTNWLCPSLGSSSNVLVSFANEINQFGASLLDCSHDDNILVGQKLLDSIGHLEERITNQMSFLLYSLGNILRLRDLSAEFKEALHLVDLTRNFSGDTDDWFIAANRQFARLAVVSTKLPVLLELKFDRIDILFWFPPVDRIPKMDWKTMFSHIQSLPPVRTLTIATGKKSVSSADTSVRIGYDMLTCSELSNFRFAYEREKRKELLEALPDEQLVQMTERNNDKKMDSLGQPFNVINVTVNSSESQSALIYSLIRLSLLSAV